MLAVDQVTQTYTMPDSYFWYTLSTLMAMALIWIVREHVSKINKTLEQLSESVALLTRLTDVHDHRLDEHDEDIKEIKGKL